MGASGHLLYLEPISEHLDRYLSVSIQRVVDAQLPIAIEAHAVESVVAVEKQVVELARVDGDYGTVKVVE